MYTTRAIILSRDIIRDKQIRLVVLSDEYGKITLWSKKLLGVDIGTLVEARIERRGSENILTQISSLACPHVETWDYATVLSYLELLSRLKILLPEGSEQKNIFSDLASLIGDSLSKREYRRGNILKKDLFLIVQNRFIKYLGMLDISPFHGDIPSKIYSRLDTASIGDILSSRPLSEEVRKMLEKSLLLSLHPYLT